MKTNDRVFQVYIRSQGTTVVIIGTTALAELMQVRVADIPPYRLFKANWGANDEYTVYETDTSDAPPTGN